MKDYMTLNETEARLQATLLHRAEDMASGDSQAWDSSKMTDPAVRLVPQSPLLRPRLPHRALAAAAVAVAVVGVSAGVALSRDGTRSLQTEGTGAESTVPPDTTSVPCGPAPPTTMPADGGTLPPTAPSTVTVPPSTTETTVPSTVTVPSTQPTTTQFTVPPSAIPTTTVVQTVAVVGAPAQEDGDCGEVGPPTTQPVEMPVARGLYISDADPATYLYLTWYPSTRMLEGIPQDEPITAGANHGFYETNAHPEGTFDAVWLVFDDGLLGLHGSLASRDELMGVAASVTRTPGTDEFTSTAPPGFTAREEHPPPTD